MSQETAPDGPDRYGFLVGKLPGAEPFGLLIPPGVPSEFVHGAVLYPVPRAPVRLRGLIQLRGQAVMVIDSAPQPDTAPPVIGQHDLLVLGGADQAVALIVQQPPSPMVGLEHSEKQPADHCLWLEPALRQAWQVREGAVEANAPVCWYDFSLEKLVDLCLFADAGTNPPAADASASGQALAGEGES